MTGSRRGLFGTLAVFVALAAFHSWYASHAIAKFDVGVMLDGAVRVTKGQLFLRDFLAPYGPLRYWLLGGLFAVFGAPLITWSWISVVLQAIAGTWLFRAAQSLSSTLEALLVTVMLALAHGSMHKGFLLLAIVVGLSGPWWRARNCHAAIIPGISAGLAFLLRYDVGGFALAATALALLVQPRSWPGRLSDAARLLAGFLLVVVPVALLLAVAGGSLTEWWDLTWQRIAVQERIRFAFPWPGTDGALQVGRLGTFLLFAGAFGLHVTWIALLLVRRRRGTFHAHDGFRLTTALFGLLLLNQARLIPSTNHVFQSLLPAYLAAADLAGHAPGRSIRRVLLAAATILLAWFVHTTTSGPYPGSYTTRSTANAPLRLPAGDLWMPAREVADLRRVVAEIRQRSQPDDALGFGPACSLVCLLAERPPAVPFAEPSYYYRSARFQRRVIDALDSSQAPLFVHDRRPTATFELSVEAPLVWQFLRRNYRVAEVVGPYELYERLR